MCVFSTFRTASYMQVEKSLNPKDWRHGHAEWNANFQKESYSYLSYAPRVFLCTGRPCVHCFCQQAMWVGMAMCTYKRDNVYPISSIVQYREPGCIMWLYYACNYTVAISPGLIPSFAVLQTEKQVFQCAALQSWAEGQGYKSSCDYVVISGFCLVCWSLEKKIPQAPRIPHEPLQLKV